MDQNFERMNIIRKFYTFLGTIIEMNEENDENEIEFLSEYLDNYNDQYLKWYETRTITTEDTDTDETDDSDGESSSSSLDLQSFLNMNEHNNYSNTVFNQENNKIPDRTLKFIENDIDIDDIILYKNNNSLISRCQNYLNSISQY